MQLGGDLQSRFLREHHIEHEQVVLIHVREHRRFVAIRCDIDGVAFFPQALLDESGNFAIVFNDENLHGQRVKK